YTEEEVHAIWQSLQAEIARRVSQMVVSEITYTKEVIDSKDESVYQDSTYYADIVALTAEERAIEHADQKHQESETYTNQVREALLQDIAQKAELDYVDGQLLLKADASYVQTINETVTTLSGISDNLLSRVSDNEVLLQEHGGSITSVTQEIDTVKGTLNLTIDQLSTLDGTVQNQQVQINANTEAIGLKASQSELDTVKNSVSSISGELEVQAGKISLNTSALQKVEGDVSTVSNNLSSLTVSVEGISSDVSSLTQTVSGHTSSISNINSSITQMSGQINAKAEQTQVDTIAGQVTSVSNQVSQLNIDVGSISTSVSEIRADFNGLEIGGRNLILNSSREFSTSNYLVAEYFIAMDFIPGEVYTVTIKGTVGETQRFGLWQNGASTSRGNLEKLGDNLHRLTFESAVTTSGNERRVRIYQPPSGTINGQIATIEWIKLEKGNRATD
ncbi:hypothetical protein ACWE42_25260, partial [Sutcliffiella cohnii]